MDAQITLGEDALFRLISDSNLFLYGLMGGKNGGSSQYTSFKKYQSKGITNWLIKTKNTRLFLKLNFSSFLAHNLCLN